MKRNLNLALTAAVLLTVTLGGPAISAASVSTLMIGADLLVNATVGSHSARLRFMSGGPAALVLNPDAAQRFGAKGSLFGAQAKVGPVLVKGRMATMSFAIGGQNSRGRVAWFDRAIAPDHDGALGPMSAPQDVVTVQLQSAQAGERSFELPMINQGNGSVGTSANLDGQELFIQWDLTRQENLATAAAGTILAKALDGQFSGKSRQAMIAFDIGRPARSLNLSRALAVGPLRLDSIVTRTSDYGDTSGIADADADPSEIVVTARGKKSKAIYTLQIGRDAMQGCSSLTFDKRRKLIILSCSATG
jgi:hypothetical protein